MDSDSETWVEGTICLQPAESAEETAGLDRDAIEEEGHGQDDEVVVFTLNMNGDLDTQGVIVKRQEGPSYLEMSCSAHNIDQEGATVQTFSSTLRENTNLDENGVIVKEREYEENVMKSQKEKVDDADVSYISNTKLTERQKTHGDMVSEYNAQLEEKQSTSISKDEKVDGKVVTKTKSSEKVISKTSTRKEELPGEDKGIAITAAGELPSVGSNPALSTSELSTEVEKVDSTKQSQDDTTFTKRSEKFQRRESIETTITGGGAKFQSLLSPGMNSSDEGAASIDLGKLGAIKLSTQISMDDVKTKNETISDVEYSSSSEPAASPVNSESVGKLEVEKPSEEAKMAEAMQDAHTTFGSLVDLEDQIEMDKKISSSEQENKNIANGLPAAPSPSAHEQDLVDIFTLPSKSGAETGEPVYARPAIETAADFPQQPDHARSNMDEKREEIAEKKKTLIADDFEEHGAEDFLASSSTSSRRSKRSEFDFHEDSPVPAFVPEDRHTADDLVKRILAEAQGKSLPPASSKGGRQKYKVDMGGGVARSLDEMSSTTADSGYSEWKEKRSRHENLSNRDEMVSGNAFTERAVGAERKRYDSGGETDDILGGYRNRKYGLEKLGNIYGAGAQTLPGYFEAYEESTTEYGRKKKQRDDYDDLLDETNLTRPQTQTRQYRPLYAEDDDEEGMSRFKPRARMTRQDYVEGEDQVYFNRQPDVEFIPDEEFIPQRRFETDEIVKERSADIRNVVERQTKVLEKLRQASESFDDLTHEIKSIKQAFLERQASRTYSQDEPDDEYEPPPQPARGRYGAGRYESSYASSDYSASSYSAGNYGYGGGYASRSVDTPAEELPGRSLGALASRSRYDKDDVTSSYMPGDYLARRGRSQSLFDEFTFDSPYSGSKDYSFTRRGKEDKDEDRPDATDDVTTKRSTSRDISSGEAAGSNGTSSYSRYGYTSRFSSTNERETTTPPTTRARPRFTRAATLSDFNFDRPSDVYSNVSPVYDTGFSSRFLQKVRDKRASGEDTEEKKERDKPFKSRFLRRSFDSDFKSSRSSYSSSARSSRSAADRSATSATTSSARMTSSSASAKSEGKSTTNGTTSAKE